MTKFIRQPPQWLKDKNPVLLAGGEVDEYKITLRLIGKGLDPFEVSELLGCEPTSSHRRGDPISSAVGEKSRLHPNGSWHLRAPNIPGALFGPQVEALLKNMTQDLAAWRILSVRGYRVELFCGVFLRSWNRRMTINPELLQQLAARGIALGLDIYAEDDA